MSALPAPTSSSAAGRPEAAVPAEPCVSCGRPAGTPFCPHCGERRAADRRYSLMHFAHEVAEAFTNTDRKFLRTLWTLVRRPGELTVAYVRGERVRYMRPLQLFLVLNVAFFLVSTWTGARVFDTPLWVHTRAAVHEGLATRMVNARLAERGTTFDQYRVAFDNASTTQAKSLVILMVPMFAVIVGLVNLRRRRYALEHLVFSLHAFSALFLILLTVAPAVEIPLAGWAHVRGLDIDAQVKDQLVPSAIVIAFGAYIAFALRRAYGDGRVAAVAKAVVLCAGLGVAVFAYRLVLFFTTFWAT